MYKVYRNLNGGRIYIESFGATWVFMGVGSGLEPFWKRCDFRAPKNKVNVMEYSELQAWNDALLYIQRCGKIKGESSTRLEKHIEVF